MPVGGLSNILSSEFNCHVQCVYSMGPCYSVIGFTMVGMFVVMCGTGHGLPVETQGVEEGRESLHEEQDADGENAPHSKDGKRGKGANDGVHA